MAGNRRLDICTALGAEAVGHWLSSHLQRRPTMWALVQAPGTLLAIQLLATVPRETVEDGHMLGPPSLTWRTQMKLSAPDLELAQLCRLRPSPAIPALPAQPLMSVAILEGRWVEGPPVTPHFI